MKAWFLRKKRMPGSGFAPFVTLAAFVAGVFVGAGLWFPLLVIVAAWLWWHVYPGKPPSPPDLPPPRDE
ncbi:hypothetical protein Ga0100231_008070 [Opitutaceae bacterium TAV4]|nr:hypothetical protein Ga0100231_008070 [Opitutaceae bacterium TAV4]RRJ98411.1 hypothetical protein Ga0100230_008370 [Opitutaceae bacterium TAV3]